MNYTISFIICFWSLAAVMLASYVFVYNSLQYGFHYNCYRVE